MHLNKLKSKLNISHLMYTIKKSIIDKMKRIHGSCKSIQFIPRAIYSYHILDFMFAIIISKLLANRCVVFWSGHLHENQENGSYKV